MYFFKRGWKRKKKEENMLALQYVYSNVLLLQHQLYNNEGKSNLTLVYFSHFSVATKDKQLLILSWCHWLPTSRHLQSHRTCFFLCASGPPRAALCGDDASVAQLVSPLEMAGVGSAHSPLNSDPLRRLYQRGAAPLPNVSSCPEYCSRANKMRSRQD